MKTKINTTIIAGTFFLTSFTLNAQKSEEDTTQIDLGSVRILVIKNANESSSKKDTIDASPSKSLKNNKLSHDAHWSGIDFGTTMLMNPSMKSDFPNHPQWENDPAKSFMWNLNFMEHKFNIVRHNVGLVTGLGFNWTQIGLKNNFVLQENSDSLWVYPDTINIYPKNKLRAIYLQVPLLLEFNTSAKRSKSLYLATGVIGGVRIGSSVKRKDSFDRKEKIKETYALNPFRLDGTVRLGYNNWGGFVNYSFLPLFDKNKTAEVFPLSFGLSYSFGS
jgi:hypothetical protein